MPWSLVTSCASTRPARSSTREGSWRPTLNSLEPKSCASTSSCRLGRGLCGAVWRRKTRPRRTPGCWRSTRSWRPSACSKRACCSDWAKRRKLRSCEPHGDGTQVALEVRQDLAAEAQAGPRGGHEARRRNSCCWQIDVTVLAVACNNVVALRWTLSLAQRGP